MVRQLIHIGYCILLVITLASCSTNSQITIQTPNKDGIIEGGWKSCKKDRETCFQRNIMKGIAKHFIYPTEARLNNYQGKVYLKVEWDKFGNLDQNSITVVKSSGYSILDNAAKNLALLIPNLDYPTTKNGKAVRSDYTFPIRYKMK